jgi:hypothetical protein
LAFGMDHLSAHFFCQSAAFGYYRRFSPAAS